MQQLPNGAVLITRVFNGWKVSLPSDIEEGNIREFVFQDGGEAEDIAVARSLQSALYEAFDGYLQSKHRAGIRIEVRASRTHEELAEDSA